MIKDLRYWQRRWLKADVAQAQKAVKSGQVCMVRVDSEPIIMYTAGLTEIGIPELLISDFESNSLHEILLSKLVDRVLTKGPITVDAEFRLQTRRATLKTISKLESRKVASLAFALYGGKLKVAQCVFSDRNGVYPWSVTKVVDDDHMANHVPLYADGPLPGDLWRRADDEIDRHARKFKKIKLRGDVDPFPGHAKIFLDALNSAVVIAKKVGGLQRFHHTNYRSGSLAISYDFQADEVRESVQESIEGIVHDAEHLSRSACILCGRKAKPSPRMVVNGAKLPFCDKHDANLAYGLLNFQYS